MNRVIVASAGSGKTTSLVKEALASPGKRILILTYTNENLANIERTFRKEVGLIPVNVKVQSWYTFLLAEGARPYHNIVSSGTRPVTVNFASGSAGSDPVRRFIRATETEKYFFDKSRGMYSDKISEYVCLCESRSGGKVISRLSKIYDSIFIDEVQDLSGWDLEILQALFSSSIEVVAVGDPRQATYSTNNSNKNSQFKGAKIVDYFRNLEQQGFCSIDLQASSYRCNQHICDLADSLYPDLPASQSLNTAVTNHDGIFFITNEQVIDYYGEYSPRVLRYDSRANTSGLEAINFGASKGLGFDRVLIFPTAKIVSFIHTRSVHVLAETTKAKLYVAITRARQSVAFVCDPPPAS
jgi:DNA helicase II / ATP-dependent DNA helicase PcrA